MIQKRSVAKKVLLLLMAAALTVSLAACGEPKDEPSQPESPPVSDSDSSSLPDSSSDSQSDEEQTVEGVVADATMNTVTITTADGKSLVFALDDDTDRTKADGLLVGDTLIVTYTGELGTDSAPGSSIKVVAIERVPGAETPAEDPEDPENAPGTDGQEGAPANGSSAS